VLSNGPHSFPEPFAPPHPLGRHRRGHQVGAGGASHADSPPPVVQRVLAKAAIEQVVSGRTPGKAMLQSRKLVKLGNKRWTRPGGRKVAIAGMPATAERRLL